MTREEAIEVFKTEHPYNPDRKDNDLHTLAKAFDMAISALSENKGDLISRQAVLELLQMKYFGKDLYKAIYELPSVENKGEWIPVIERLPENGELVLCSVADSNHSVIISCVDTNQSYWHNGKIYAWQPLPEPYKAESEDKE